MAIYKELIVIASCPFSSSSSPDKEASSYTTPFLKNDDFFEHHFKNQDKTKH